MAASSIPAAAARRAALQRPWYLRSHSWRSSLDSVRSAAASLLRWASDQDDSASSRTGTSPTSSSLKNVLRRDRRSLSAMVTTMRRSQPAKASGSCRSLSRLKART